MTIDSIPIRFQKKCAATVMAKYTLRTDGKTEVFNQCTEANGKIRSVKGTAKVVDKVTNDKLKVTFFWPFSADYWIMALGPDYEYAVVGQPCRKYLWVLSRSREIDQELYDNLLTKIQGHRYDISRIQPTAQHLDSRFPARASK